MKEAKSIAEEWVTEMRLTHLLTKYPTFNDITHTGKVVLAMIEDIKREAEREVIWSKEAERAIGKKVAVMFKNRLQSKLREKNRGDNPIQ